MNNTTGQTPGITTTSGAADLPEALINIAREIEALKRDCGMDPESSIAIQNGRYMAISSKIRALAAGQATAAQAVVPAEWPTNEMIDAGRKAAASQGRLLGSGQSLWHVFRAMLAAAPAQPAAQQEAACAALPTSSYAGRVYEEGFLIGTCPLYTADQMRSFADATYMLRASHGQAPATQQAGATKEHVHLVRVIADKIEDGTLFRSGIYSNKDLARFVRNVADAAAPQPSPTAQAADSVQEDAARLDFLIEQRAYVVSDPDACPGHWLHWAMPDGRTWVQGDEHPTPRAAIDAARKQGARWQSAVRALTLHI